MQCRHAVRVDAKEEVGRQRHGWRRDEAQEGAARVAERQARLGLASPSTSCPRETDFLRHNDQPGGGSSSHDSADLNQCEIESSEVSARLAALTAVPMRAWTQSRVLEWAGTLELSPADAAVVKAAVAEEEINGDDLVDLKPKCVETSPVPSLSVCQWNCYLPES